eukprot:gene17768-biopygen2354
MLQGDLAMLSNGNLAKQIVLAPPKSVCYRHKCHPTAKKHAPTAEKCPPTAKKCHPAAVGRGVAMMWCEFFVLPRRGWKTTVARPPARCTNLLCFYTFAPKKVFVVLRSGKPSVCMAHSLRRVSGFTTAPRMDSRGACAATRAARPPPGRPQLARAGGVRAVWERIKMFISLFTDHCMFTFMDVYAYDAYVYGLPMALSQK